MKNIAILGSTGSIGTSALDVIRNHPSRFRAVALAAGRNIALLRDQIDVFRPRFVSVCGEEEAQKLSTMLGPSETEILCGPFGYEAVAACEEANMVLSALVGAAGLLPTLRAIECGKDIALANKETLVMAGRLVMERASANGVRILPVDSEHSAIFQCLAHESLENVRRIILTASGGPFRSRPVEEMHTVTVEEALRHPNWKMGRKITVDSATMMNKGLEVIEAHWLFGASTDRIDVLIHPQSIIHSMVEYMDGSIIAQFGIPDMKGPIAYALSFPERLHRNGAFLDFFEAGPLTFSPPDLNRFPCLKLAYEAGKKGGTMPSALNAANEVAVEAFLEGEIGFLDIPGTIEKTLAAHRNTTSDSIEEVLLADQWARQAANEYIARLKKTK